jgi:hypothetical protein
MLFLEGSRARLRSLHRELASDPLSLAGPKFDAMDKYLNNADERPAGGAWTDHPLRATIFR